MADVDGDGLTDVYFVNQVGGNQLWRNAGGGRFEDVTATAGVALADRVNVSASFADIRQRRRSGSLRDQPRSGFIVTPFFTLDASGGDKGHRDARGATGRITIWGARASRSSVVFDIDGDGDLDIITMNSTPSRWCS